MPGSTDPAGRNGSVLDSPVPPAPSRATQCTWTGSTDPIRRTISMTSSKLLQTDS